MAIIIKGLQWLLNRSIRQKHRFASGSIVFRMPLTDHHRIEGVGLEVAAVVLAPMRRRPILVIGGQCRYAHDLGLQPFGPGGSALPVTDRMHPASMSHPLASCRLRPGIGGHRHNRFGGYDRAEPLLVEPPQIRTIQKSLIKDDLVQAGVASQIRPCLGDQLPGPVGFMRLNLPHLDGQRELGHGLDHEEHFPAVDRHLDRMHLAACILDRPVRVTWPHLV
jgi:hypothetical protein